MYPFRNKLFSRRRGFTLLEVTVATLILAILATTVLVILDRCIDATMDLELRMRAFSVARENMERLLGGSSVTETTEFGIDELNPAIEWETIVEPFYEPITNRMWIQAVCSAGYTDSKNEMQTVQLTHWITSLTDKQIKQIEDQRQKEQEYLDL
ncbi:MAG: type II secretion system protein, partial [Sedimentisphaerales bacterium]|nr:type II secretion system protein [Sedimentisphaerales bacterium]